MPNDFPSASDQECRIGGYLLLRMIGKGSLQVTLARHIVTGTEVAVKIINRRSTSLGFREIQCLQHLNHPHITRLFEVIVTEDQYFLVMEHLSGGELSHYLEQRGALTEEEARILFRQLLSALYHCHEKGFAHRDLKPENILLDGDHNIKLADFGLSKQFKNNLLRSFCGTLTYMAPEIMSSQPYDGQRVDIWSLRVILYQMVTGRLPFEGQTYGEVKRWVLGGHFPLPYFVSEECQHLLQNIITLDSAQRPTLDAIIRDPRVTRGQQEGVKTYSEPLCGDVDPQISEQMKHLGYNQEEVRESVAHKTFDNIMGTYLILHSMKRNIRGQFWLYQRGQKQPAEFILWDCIGHSTGDPAGQALRLSEGCHLECQCDINFYQMVTERFPFKGENFGEVKRRVFPGRFSYPNLSLRNAHIYKKLAPTIPPRGQLWMP